MRPPIGLIRRDVFEASVSAERLEQVKAAIIRYIDAGLGIPPEWVAEHAELLQKLDPTRQPRY